MASSDSPQQLLLERLVAQQKDHEDWALHVLAACEGPDALAKLLDDGVEPSTARARPASPRPRTAAPRAFLQSIAIRGFRGIGPESTLALIPGPGLTLVVGRNGSGKSSFAEGLEVLLTGESVRWSGKGNRFWKAGWSNLHASDPPFVRAELIVEGSGVVTVERRWADAHDLDASETRVQQSGRRFERLDETAWAGAVADYRPFMSHNELESLLEEGPSVLHKALLSGLGLEQFEATRTSLAKAASARKKQRQDTKKRAGEIASQCDVLLAQHADERLRHARALLKATTWDLERLAVLATGGIEADEGELALLDAVARLTAPAIEHTERLALALRQSGARVDELATLEAGRARDLAALLDTALRVTEGTRTNDCPLCGTAGIIDADWRARTSAEAARLRARAAEADAARTRLDAIVHEAHLLCGGAPPGMSDAQIAQQPAIEAARTAFAEWTAGRQIADPSRLAAHLEHAGPALRHAVANAVAWARAESARRQDVWRPIATRLGAWLEDARAAERSRGAKSQLAAAEAWVSGAIEDLRDERFRPIEREALANWALVRLQSNVELTSIELAGSGKQRSVHLQVAVDGTPAAALGVMSQGELNALVLSLFLPRTQLPENPFGFVIIDDPVQAMDPARVEGLAKLLAATAKTRQVVVFTHDDRLPEAIHRLQIEARQIEVVRRAKSAVELRAKGDPVDAYFSDAHALIKAAQSDDIPDGVLQAVVPGFCRSALEAACIEAVRRRRLRAGDRHGEVEALLEQSRALRKLIALALFDDPEKVGENKARLRSSSPDWVEVYDQVQGGAHGDRVPDLAWLLERTKKMTGFLRKL